MKKILALVLVLVLAVGSFAACGGGESSAPSVEPSEVSPSTDPAVSPESPASVTPTGEKKTFYFITKTLGNQYWAVVEQGVRDAAAELGVEVVVTGIANEAEVEKQVQLLQDAVSAKADGILIGPTDSYALSPQVEATFDAGIPIVMVDTMIDTDKFSAAFLTDNVAAGETAAEEMITRMKAAGISETETAEIAVQVGSSGSQTIIDRLDGFNTYWKANAPEAWIVLNDDVKVNDGDISKAVGFTQDFLTAYPNLKAVFGPNNGSTVGFVTGLQEANRTDIVMVGFDFSDDIKGMIEGGEFEVASVVQKQYFMGYEGLKAAVALSNGETIAEKTVDTGVLVVDKNNVNSAEVQEIINPGK